MNASVTITRMRIGSRRLFLAALGFAALGTGLAAAVPIKVSGMGWWHGRDMRLALERLIGAKTAETLSSNAIEDAAVILLSSLYQEGFQQPKIEIVVTLKDGTEKRFPFDPTFAVPIPRPLEARAVAFDITPGVRWRVAHVPIEGLTVFPAKEGEAYFRSDSALFNTAQANAYSKGQVNRAEGALLDELKRRGRHRGGDR